MKIIDIIKNYINRVEPSEPVFTDEIFERVKTLIPNADKAVFNTCLQRYEKTDGSFLRYRKGIYYKTVETPFGSAKIDRAALVRKSYITDGKRIFGYETGPSYMCKIGLTTQIPGMTYVATEKVRYTMANRELNVLLKKPVIKIDENNYRYLQFLDILDNKEKIATDSDRYYEILLGQIERFGLDFKRLTGYAEYYENNNVYKGLSRLARW